MGQNGRLEKRRCPLQKVAAGLDYWEITAIIWNQSSSKVLMNLIASLSKRDATMVVALRVTRAQTASTSGYRFGKYRKYGAVAAHCAV